MEKPIKPNHVGLQTCNAIRFQSPKVFINRVTARVSHLTNNTHGFLLIVLIVIVLIVIVLNQFHIYLYSRLKVQYFNWSVTRFMETRASLMGGYALSRLQSISVGEEDESASVKEHDHREISPTCCVGCVGEGGEDGKCDSCFPW
ncbi:hypothetical protein L6452_28394 [Arctium lappa]|uniref:Uncharacterized protein n=1 Tax=Arctium lappa TaxID=4217 RepID=A0ACB8ZYU4_ARCLA|nr:hypothetical protein L6452_28394 [Arctium lappa]